MRRPEWHTVHYSNSPNSNQNDVSNKFADHTNKLYIDEEKMNNYNSHICNDAPDSGSDIGTESDSDSIIGILGNIILHAIIFE